MNFLEKIVVMKRLTIDISWMTDFIPVPSLSHIFKYSTSWRLIGWIIFELTYFFSFSKVKSSFFGMENSFIFWGLKIEMILTLDWWTSTFQKMSVIIAASISNKNTVKILFLTKNINRFQAIIFFKMILFLIGLIHIFYCFWNLWQSLDQKWPEWASVSDLSRDTCFRMRNRP